MRALKKTEEEIANARRKLEQTLTEGQLVYTTQTTGDARGTTRYYRVYIAAVLFIPDLHGEIQDITYYIARVCGYKMNDRGIRITGSGFDGGGDIVDTLNRVLFRDRIGLQEEKL